MEWIEIKKLVENYKTEDFIKFSGLIRNELYKIKNNLYLLQFIAFDDKLGKHYANFIRFNTNGSYCTTNSINKYELSEVEFFGTRRYVDILNYIEEKIYTIEKNKKLTVGEAEERVNFWKHKQWKIKGKCPHNFKERYGNADCLICGLDKE